MKFIRYAKNKHAVAVSPTLHRKVVTSFFYQLIESMWQYLEGIWKLFSNNKIVSGTVYKRTRGQNQKESKIQIILRVISNHDFVTFPSVIKNLKLSS